MEVHKHTQTLPADQVFDSQQLGGGGDGGGGGFLPLITCIPQL